MLLVWSPASGSAAVAAAAAAAAAAALGVAASTWIVVSAALATAKDDRLTEAVLVLLVALRALLVRLRR
jgi:hypothetical protein